MSRFIRAADIDDAALLAHLHRQCFDEPWDESSFRGLLERTGAFALLAGEAATELQAFILIQLAAGESEIQSLGTLPNARGRGFGLALVKAAAAEAFRRGAREMFLEVAQDNVAALKVYARAGFIQAGERRGYYPRKNASAVDAAILRVSLPF